MRTTIFVVLAWMALTGSAFAQHPCDELWQDMQLITPGEMYRIQICALGTLTDAILIVNGTERQKQPLMRVQGPPNAAGLSLFEGVDDVTLAEGAYVLSARVFTNSVEQPRTEVLAVQAGAITQPIPPVSTSSAVGTMVPPASFIIDAKGRKWTRRATDGAILVDGKQAAAGAATEVLLWSDGIYAHTPTSTKDYWFKWNDQAVDWALTTDPRIATPPPPPPPTPVVIPPPPPAPPAPVVPFCSGVIAQAVKHLAKSDQIVITCEGRVTVAKGAKVDVVKK